MYERSGDDTSETRHFDPERERDARESNAGRPEIRTSETERAVVCTGREGVDSRVRERESGDSYLIWSEHENTPALCGHSESSSIEPHDLLGPGHLGLLEAVLGLDRLRHEAAAEIMPILALEVGGAKFGRRE